ncbi:MlaD family protein [Rhodococcus sp. NPDC078407]|uniref:MlaD family protein n=1 Tax=Rhodococcus TaxID=1827 RepID=UPI000A7078AB|nr:MULTISPECIES: MlaD family protein [Rhodococcus]SUH12238.1 Mce family protein [Rhodococcus erythropolis]
MNRSSTLISILALAVVFVVGLGYLVVGVAHINPTRSEYSLTAIIDSSGGLLDTSPVMVRGVPVGKVSSINVADSAIKVEMTIDSDHKIPQDSEMSIQNLSLAGEQYINFVPAGTATGGYFDNGDVVPADAVHVSQSVPQVLPKLAAVADGLDPESIESINKTVAEAVAGRQDDLDTIGDMMHRVVDFVGKDGSVRVTADNAEFLLGLLSNAGDVLSTASVRTPDAVNGLARIQRAFIRFTTTSYDKWPPVLKLVEKLNGYIQILQPDLLTITRAVKPATEKVADTYVDFGSIGDLLGRTFPASRPGRAEVPVTVSPPLR